MRAAWQTIHPAVLPRDLTRFPSPHDSGAGFLYGLDNMAEMTTTGFDYSKLEEDTAAKLEYYATTGRALIRKSQIEFIAQLGEILSDARKVLANNKNGTFEKWATVEFDIGKQTVWNYVNAWDRILSNGWTIYSNLSPTAIYLLASEDTPKPIQKKLERLAAENGTVKRVDVQRLIDAAKQKPSPQKPPSKPVEAPASDEIEPAPAIVQEPWGETEAEPDPQPLNPADWKIQRSKAKKTAEALQRALGDLNDMKPITFLPDALSCVRAIISQLGAVK
jgi:hypothetical protein